MRQAHEIHVAGEQSLPGDRLAFARGHGRDGRSIPRLRHIASTFARVASSITILSGHSRVKPSSFHLRVASIPILEPYVKPRLEWSSTSIGPMLNRTSRPGAMWFSATHHASLGPRTFTSLPSTTLPLASDLSPC